MVVERKKNFSRATATGAPVDDLWWAFKNTPYLGKIVTARTDTLKKKEEKRKKVKKIKRFIYPMRGGRKRQSITL